MTQWEIKHFCGGHPWYMLRCCDITAKKTVPCVFITSSTCICLLIWTSTVAGVRAKCSHYRMKWHSTRAKMEPTPDSATVDCTVAIYFKHSNRGATAKDRKFSSTCGTRTHDLLLSGQAHYHCAKGEAASGR